LKAGHFADGDMHGRRVNGMGGGDGFVGGGDG